MDPTNKERAAWAYQACQEFARAKGEVFDTDDVETEAQDLITDLLHLVGKRKAKRVLEWAVGNYEMEKGGTQK